MQPVYKFIIWFVVSLLSVFLFLEIISNPFTRAFVIALVIAFAATIKD